MLGQISKIVTVHLSEGQIVRFVGVKQSSPPIIISAVRVNQLLKQRCRWYLAYVIEKHHDKARIASIPSVWVLNVFPNELPGLTLHQEIEISIDILLGTAPISKAPSRMDLTELREMSEQLQEHQYGEIHLCSLQRKIGP